MKRSEDNPLPDGSSSRRRFFQVLDKLAGIDGIGLEPLDEAQVERTMRQAERVPLSPAALDRAVSQWRSLREAAAAHKASPPWWRRRAAVIPIAGVLLMGAAAPVYLAWSGRSSSKELRYEDALDVVFDEDYPVLSRLAAQGRVASSVGRGITALKHCAKEGGGLGTAAALALATVKAAVLEASVARERAPAPRSYESSLAALSDKALPDPQRMRALEEVVEAIQSGMRTLRASRSLGAQFREHADRYFRNLARRLSR